MRKKQTVIFTALLCAMLIGCTDTKSDDIPVKEGIASDIEQGNQVSDVHGSSEENLATQEEVHEDISLNGIDVYEQNVIDDVIIQLCFEYCNSDGVVANCTLRMLDTDSYYENLSGIFDSIDSQENITILHGGEEADILKVTYVNESAIVYEFALTEEENDIFRQCSLEIDSNGEYFAPDELIELLLTDLNVK